MSDLAHLPTRGPRASPPRRRRRGSRGRLLALLLFVLLVCALLAGAVLGGRAVLSAVRGAGTPDYSGQGRGEVVVQVKDGDTAAAIAGTLKARDVVKSEAAFRKAALADERSRTVQPGFYTLRTQMSGAAAVGLLLDPASRSHSRVTLPEGVTTAVALQKIADATQQPLADLQAAVADPAALGLPSYARGQVEGFLFPATYDIEPGTTAPQVLAMLIDRFEQAADTVGLVEGAERLGLTPYEVVVVASLIEREVRRDEEYGQVARVVYNRLEQDIPLGIDAAVLFGVGKTAGGELTRSDLAQDTPYENRRQTGLPPTPIASPGEATLRGALNPVDGDILYYVLADKEGRTFFTEDYNAFLRQRDRSRAEGVF